jgi:trk system potassium uptake protein TrkH
MLSDEMNDELASSLSFALLFLLMLIGGTIISVLFMGNGFTYSDALFESASAMGTVGLSTGIVGPSMSSRLEVTYIIEMLAGRLEIIPIFALIRALFWGTNP